MIALDATYSVGSGLTGVGVYCREVLYGLAAAHPEARFRFCYRPHRFFKAFREPLPSNARRGLLQEPLGWGWSELFHGLNQRLPRTRLRRAVTTFHDLFVLTGDYSTPEFRRRFAEQARDAAARSDLILTVSEFTRGQVRDLLGVEPSRIRAIPHGVHPRTPRDVPRQPVILHVGAIQKRKNLERLVEAFERIFADRPEWRLVLAGGAGYGAAAILDRIARSGCRSRIQVTGYVTPEELDHWYATASVFAFPSLDEGFGIPVLEAMAAGLPVVTSRRAALPEAAGDAALLIDPEDTDELASALERLSLDEEFRRTHRQRGLVRAAQFPWTRTVERTWEAYRSLLTG
ncbi:MAG: glycosyltransferase family 4 protein [Bryobacterales bacterium]|nr:glycosyltransferase family 4 protein [Bryobacterales bacterium]